MHLLSRKGYIALLLGDISILYLSVWVTITLRHLTTPDPELVAAHLTSFSFLFIAWFLVYFLSGLYGRYTLLFRKQLPRILFVSQAINVGIAALLFFSVPFFQITPKTILVMYLFISTALLYLWRVYMYPNLSVRRQIGAVLVGTGQDITDLVEEVNKDPVYPLTFKAIIHPELANEKIKKAIGTLIKKGTASTIVADMGNNALHALLRFIYELTFVDRNAVFVIDVQRLYQEIFERVPLSLIDDRWLLNNVSLVSHRVYDISKRTADITGSILLGVIAILIYPFIAAAIKIEDKGPILIAQRRIGKYAREFTLYKFRSMTQSDDGVWIADNGNKKDNRITRVGAFIRRTHLDELPQLWNVLKGDISLVGPRPDICGIYDTLVESIPFYKLRYSVTPGITGWAQTKQQYTKGNISPQSLEETKMRLQYDLYYVQNRSLLLDIQIILKTLKVIITRSNY